MSGLPRHRTVSVTPELASEWLKRNTRNRPIRKGRVDAMVRAMKSGKFEYNGDTVRFDVTGALLDGQHRLSAVVASGVTTTMLIVEGLPAAVQATIDQGITRTAGDALHFQGHRSWNELAAVSRLAMSVEYNASDRAYRPGNEEIVEYVQQHPEIHASVEFGSATNRRYPDATKTIISYTHMMFAHVDLSDANYFWQSMADLVPAYRDDPVIALARRLADIRRNRIRLPSPTVLSLVYRTWNKRRAGQPVARIQVVETKSFADLPVIR